MPCLGCRLIRKNSGHWIVDRWAQPRLRLSLCWRQGDALLPSIYNHSVYSLYSLLLFLALIVSTPWWIVQMLRHGKYRTGWSERLGTVPDRLFNKVAENTIWIHAVSVGEVLASSRVVDELKARLPDWRIVVSTTTDTGQKLARERFGENNVFYLPLDLPWAVRAYMQALRPKMLVLAESEFWPNLLHEARRSGAAVAVVNARVSDRSLPGYLRFHTLLQRVMQNVDLFLAQSDEDARRLIQIGASADRVHVSGNLKFEVKPHARPAIIETFTAALEREDIGPDRGRGQHAGRRRDYAVRHVPTGGIAISRGAAGAGPADIPNALAWSLPCSLLPVCAGSFAREWDGTRAIAGGVFLLDTIGELAEPLRFCRHRLRRRQPGATWRTQRARSRAIRRCHPGGPAHGKLPRHRRCLLPGRCAAGCHAAIAHARRCCSFSKTTTSAPLSAHARPRSCARSRERPG